jgi:hypothetical protein
MKRILELLSRFFNRPDLHIAAETTAVNPNSSTNFQINFSCNQKDIDHLDSLVRYYETRYEGVVSRGIWLLTLMRNSEIESKRLAVIEVDEESGQVVTVSPITLN